MTKKQSNPIINNRLKRIIQSIERIRPMPSNVNRIITVINSGEANANIISELLGLDQALAINVLQAANSAYLGFGPSCSNLNEAVMRLGFERIKTLVLGVAVSNEIKGGLPGYRLGAGELWNHSITTAISAQWFARAFSYPHPDDAYVAGLIHDIGKLILDQFALADYDRIFQLVQNYNLSFYEVEKKIFGIDHATVGGLMAHKWSFPPVLIEIIQYHHNPIKAENKELAAIVNIANALGPMDPVTVRKMGKREIHKECLSIFNLSKEKLDTLTQKMVFAVKMAQ